MEMIILYIATLLTSWQFAHEQDLQNSHTQQQVWQTVTVPHDWAISGPFDRSNDLQVIAVVQNGESQATAKTGRSGGLPWMGAAWYKTTFTADTTHQTHILLFDGAMAHPQVYVNNQYVGEWQYGYNSFSIDISDVILHGINTLSVRLENVPESSRWYPGAGLFRNVHYIQTGKVHIPIWGVHTTTPYISDSLCTVQVDVNVVHADSLTRVETDILDGDKVLATIRQARGVAVIRNAQLWSPEHPYIYRTRTRVYQLNVTGDSIVTDERETTLGFRKIEYVPGIGFMLNGKVRKFQGVCLHHDLGALGAAVNKDALRHQLTLMKEMGADAVRTSHNMPAPELVELCDEMGLMMMIEPFDVWTHNKCRNGYASFFHDWAERDITNMIMHYRNNPCVMMWSIGNEVWDQTFPTGYLTARYLQDICHRLDATRPVTCGMDQVLSVLYNGFAAELDIPGFNYRTMRYEQAYNTLPQGLILGSETASTVSSRNTYHLPAVLAPDQIHADQQSSGYDLEYCSWSGLPEQDFQLQDDYTWTIGQFIWTGIDYLGEPSPYDTDAWPSHSSYFGAVDLAMLPKDRFYLYRSQWNKQSPTLHILPHWNWEGHEGQEVPVFVYTSYPSAELFVNGKSQGKLRFATAEEADQIRQGKHIEGVSQMPVVGDFTVPVWGSEPRPELLPRYRLMWHHVRYEPGEIKVVAYSEDGAVAEEKIIRTANRPHHLQVEWANKNEKHEQENTRLAYLTISVVDKDGNLCPNADPVIRAKVSNGTFKGAANGDANCLYAFTDPVMPAFKGQCTFIVEGKEGETTIQFSAKSIPTTKFILQ